MWNEDKRIEKANWQSDKMLKLEFVAIQFGVKFTIMYKLFLCGWSLPAASTSFQFFRKLFIFGNYFVILSLFIYFQGHSILFLIWIYDLGKPFQLGRNFAAFLLDDQIDGGRRG